MSDGETETESVAPKKRRGRKPGAKAIARRHDPDDAPIDGDFQKDHVVNRDPSKCYALVSVDDMPKMLGRGYVATARGAGAARPAYDIGDDSQSGYRVDSLTLMEIPRERYERIQRQAVMAGDRARGSSKAKALRIDPTGQGQITHSVRN